MPNEYWAQVLAFETPEHAEIQYKLLEDKLKDLLKDRCLLSELDLNPFSTYDEKVRVPKEDSAKRVANKSEIMKKRLSVRQYSPKPQSATIQTHKIRLSDNFLQPINTTTVRSRQPSARRSISSKKRVSMSIQY